MDDTPWILLISIFSIEALRLTISIISIALILRYASHINKNARIFLLIGSVSLGAASMHAIVTQFMFWGGRAVIMTTLMNAFFFLGNILMLSVPIGYGAGLLSLLKQNNT